MEQTVIGGARPKHRLTIPARSLLNDIDHLIRTGGATRTG
jgi:hypothetical protein